MATRPEVVTQVLGIVYRAISGHLIRKGGLTRASATTGAVTLIQRFGSMGGWGLEDTPEAAVSLADQIALSGRTPGRKAFSSGVMPDDPVRISRP